MPGARVTVLTARLEQVGFLRQVTGRREFCAAVIWPKSHVSLLWAVALLGALSHPEWVSGFVASDPPM